MPPDDDRPTPGEPRQALPRATLALWRLQGMALGVFVATSAVGSLVGGPWTALALVVALAAGWFGPLVPWRRWRYEIRDEEIDLRHGLWTVKRTLVPIRRVQHVDTSSGPLQSMFDLASVSVHTAAGATTIPGLLRGDAEAVRRRVSDLARARDDV